MPAESGAKGGGDGDRSEEQSVDLRESDSNDEVQCTRRYVCVCACVCVCVCVWVGGWVGVGGYVCMGGHVYVCLYYMSRVIVVRSLLYRLFGGLIRDAKRRYLMYPSDILDAFHLPNLSSSISSVIFVYLLSLALAYLYGVFLAQHTSDLLVRVPIH